MAGVFDCERIESMKKDIRRKMIAFALTLGLILPGFSAVFSIKAQAKTPVVVCIDPGHGGSNDGAAYNGLWEKDLTLQIAGAMYQELSLYEGVTVVMTRTADVDLTLEQRAQIAADAGADFLYSIHLNASPSHNLFGSEVWVSAYDDYYAKGMSFGNIALQQLSEDVGVYPRGVKTKMSGRGTGDYYGVINHARLKGVAAVIIEHCHMDEAHDKGFYMKEGALQKLGKADATAVAKYYGLKSSVLGVDYSNYQYVQYPNAKTPHMQDMTDPEVAQIELISYDKNTGKVQLRAKASDAQSRIIYYSYSGNGGVTWSGLWGWAPAGEGYIELTLPEDATGDLCIRVHNEYDRFTESNHIFLQ